ncbi:hypothetical protein MRX96_053329, partial [Rhipicephalus microplus]
YVYAPIVGPQRKTLWRVLGVAAAFTCVWVWHSMTTAVTFWATLSFTGIALEVVMAHIKRLDCVKSFEVRFPIPLVPVLVSLYFGAYTSQDVMQREAEAAAAKVKEPYVVAEASRSGPSAAYVASGYAEANAVKLQFAELP